MDGIEHRAAAVGRTPRWSFILDGLCFAALTILVWGVNALQRGMWQDDVQALALAFARSGSFRDLFAPDVSPLRRLTVLPSALAYATPHPVWALQILCAAIWLGQALLAGWITGLLLPGRRRVRFLVVCLTLTATSDLTTGSMLTLGYNFGALQLLAAAGCALFWLGSGRTVTRSVALLASAILLLCSLLTIDVAVPAVPFLVLLFVSLGVSAARTEIDAIWTSGAARRAAILLIAWSIVVIPFAIAEWRFLHDPTSYAAVALVPMPKGQLVHRAIELWLVNFTPWRWAFARPAWWTRPAAVIPAVWMAAGSLVATLLFLFRFRTKNDDAGEDGRRSILLAALFITMALAANALYSFVQLSEIWYRTQILSRVWASMAIGILAGWAWRRAPVLRWLAYAVVTAFVFFGAWGGFERQDYFLSVWRWHQRELTSILNAAPALRPGTAIILRGTPPPGRYLATEADYLARCWLMLLYEDRHLQIMRLNPARASGCIAEHDGFDCWLEGQAACFADKTCEPFRFPFDSLVLMDYDSGTGTYRIVSSLRNDPLVKGYEIDAERYHPEKRIVFQPLTLKQRRLLLE
jgi:hypothetical protein